MTDEPEPTDQAPPTKVEIAVAAHSVSIESAGPLETVAAKALELFRETADYAKRSPVGFAATGGTAERAEPQCHDDSGVGWTS